MDVLADGVDAGDESADDLGLLLRRIWRQSIDKRRCRVRINLDLTRIVIESEDEGRVSSRTSELTLIRTGPGPGAAGSSPFDGASMTD